MSEVKKEEKVDSESVDLEDDSDYN